MPVVVKESMAKRAVSGGPNNRVVDLNGSGGISPDEYIGIKRKFRESEPITTGIRMNTWGGLIKFEFRLYNQNKELININKQESTRVSTRFRLNARELVRKNGYGLYQVDFYKNEKHFRSAVFEIVPDNQN